MSSIAPLVFRTASIGVLSYGLVNSFLGDAPLDQWIRTDFAYAGHLQLVSVLGAIAALASFSTGILSDLTGSQGLRSAKRFLTLVTLPTQALIALAYCTTLFKLVNPKTLRVLPSGAMNATIPVFDDSTTPAHLPFDVDFSLHAIPGLALVLDFFLFEERFLADTVVLPIISTASLSYAAWVEYCAEKNGKFAYPLLDGSCLEYRIAVYTISALLAFWSFSILNSVHPSRK
ncbi:hypothetical protein CYLTODRAFT_445228 [Cylindrobasidium torrendii FP15055 ss-10]|uniref:Uncharacterized protein n=1 Tax=Cylindrobasidium torrendii FP15055 ss-10 TaxID=1314674 RepID=A0A0D7B7Y0_9AGAR|nr:hypothetical protein CYLTODRAFT_445228 [Cylindrobasidium torrendii FP15055 ss-10]